MQTNSNWALGGARSAYSTQGGTQYGGDVAPNGSTWPPMDSGQFASAGYGYAAYQRSIFYIDTSDTTAAFRCAGHPRRHGPLPDPSPRFSGKGPGPEVLPP